MRGCDHRWPWADDDVDVCAVISPHSCAHNDNYNHQQDHHKHFIYFHGHHNNIDGYIRHDHNRDVHVHCLNLNFKPNQYLFHNYLFLGGNHQVWHHGHLHHCHLVCQPRGLVEL